MAPSLFHTLNISSQDMKNRMQELDTIGNNLANVNTTGFRGTRMNFQEMYNEKCVEGNKTICSQVLTHQGNLQTTNNPLDWAIQGDGFFPVKMPNGEIGYTRDGVFHLDEKQQLVNSSGYLLNWTGSIPLEAADIGISENGQVEAIFVDGSTRNVGSLKLALFANPSGLVSAGNNLWIPGDASGEAKIGTPGVNGCGVIKAHAYESANVNLADEMTHMIQVQRGFQMTARVFQQTDTMISEAIHMRKV